MNYPYSLKTKKSGYFKPNYDGGDGMVVTLCGEMFLIQVSLFFSGALENLCRKKFAVPLVFDGG